MAVVLGEAVWCAEVADALVRFQQCLDAGAHISHDGLHLLKQVLHLVLKDHRLRGDLRSCGDVRVAGPVADCVVDAPAEAVEPRLGVGLLLLDGEQLLLRIGECSRRVGVELRDDRAD